MYAGATDSSPSSLSADAADSDEELEIFHTTKSTSSDSHSAETGGSDKNSATRPWSHDDHCSIGEGTALAAPKKTGKDDSITRGSKKTELTVILGKAEVNSWDLDQQTPKNETPFFVSSLTVENESAIKPGRVQDPASKYRVLEDVQEEYDSAIIESTESARSRNVVGTFNFLGCAKSSSSLANTPSEGPESLEDSYASLQDGVTVLGMYNFVGPGVPADAGVLRNGVRPEESPELPSLTDSIVSLEDGKHLLGVYDFTKPKQDAKDKVRVSRSEGRSSSAGCEREVRESGENTSPDPVVEDTGLEEKEGCVLDPPGKDQDSAPNAAQDSIPVQALDPTPNAVQESRSSPEPLSCSTFSQEDLPSFEKFTSVEVVCLSPLKKADAEDQDFTTEGAEAAEGTEEVSEDAAATDDSHQGKTCCCLLFVTFA